MQLPPFYKCFIPVIVLLCGSFHTAIAQLSAQPDSIFVRKPSDTARKPTAPVQRKKLSPAEKIRQDTTFSPHKATVRSAMLPGWGQVYNRQVWKVPLVYGALGTTAGIFIYNLRNYRDLRRMYILITDGDTSNDNQIPYKLSPLKNNPNSVQYYRNEFRRNVDYSVLAFLIAWGLNVVDATVSAHLRQFDVSDDLSLQVRPILHPQTGLGVGLVLNIK
jgi:hypothetical protein